MKKTIAKLVLLVFLIFIYTNKIVADELTCSEEKVLMTETTMFGPTHITATMPVCGTFTISGFQQVSIGSGVGVPQGGRQDWSDYTWVTGIGDYHDWYTIKRADNKGVITVSLPICSDPKSYVKGILPCTYTARVRPTYTPHSHTEEYVDQDCVKKLEEGDDDSPPSGGGGNTVISPVRPNPRPEIVREASKSFLDIKPEIFDNELIINPKVSNMEAMVVDDGGGGGCSTCDKKVDRSGLSANEIACIKTKTVSDPDTISCDTGWTFNKASNKDDQWCEKEETWTYEDKKEGDAEHTSRQVNVSTAISECKTANSVSSCTCNASDIAYAFYCPVYTCTKEDKEVELCTPVFQTPTGGTVYCVNPGQEFSSGYSTTAEYIPDSDFSVKNCETSYSTVDCGYANILIEGAKYEIPDKTIEFAMRLWGVHTQQAGFDTIGISNRTGTNCGTATYFMLSNGYSGDLINPYVETYKEFAKVILDKVRYKDEIIPTGDLSVFEITCDKNKLGVACGTGDQEYKVALALLANTVLGNNKMQEHLRDLFDGEISEEVETAELMTSEDGTQYVQVTFEELREVTHNSNLKIDCTKLDEMVSSGKITAEQKEQIEPFCRVEISLVDGRGRELPGYGPAYPDYCIKNYCRRKLENFAICDLDESITTPIKIVVTYEKSPSSKSVTKYVSCSNPLNNQILFGFDADLTDTETHPSTDPTEEREPYSETFEIRNYKCAGFCDDYSIREDSKDNCDDNASNYNRTYDSSFKDPSLKCILNMGSAAYKNSYNYSDEFEVGNRFCRIYCSDEVVFHMADKIKETSGKRFYYDIERSVRNDKNIRYLFTNIVEEKRNCVSEIYYDVNKFSDSVDWKGIYNLGKTTRGTSDGITDEEIEGIDSWKTLFEVLVKKAQNEGGRTENINRILYDLFNCNLYTEKEIKDAGVVKPKDYKAKNIKETIIKKFQKSNNYGIGTDTNCKFGASDAERDRECVSMNNIQYDFGAPTAGKTAVMKSVVSSKNTLSDLIYCSGEDCFYYDLDHPENEYNYPTNKTSSTETLDVKETFGDNTRISGQVFSSDKVDIPINDYVMFTVQTDISFYNSSRYQVKPDGKVITAGSERGKNYLLLDAYAYTVDRNAYNSGVCSDRDFLKGINYRRCNITHSYNRIETYFRKNSNDSFYTTVNNHKNHSCYVDVEIPSPECDPSKQICRIGTTYRNVDIANMFPSSTDGYTTKTNSNWGTENGKKATLNITQSASTIRTTEEYLQYSITLNPVQIENIKSYNNNNTYVNEAVFNCQISGDTYRNCISPFMEELRTNGEYGTIDQKHNGKN